MVLPFPLTLGRLTRCIFLSTLLPCFVVPASAATRITFEEPGLPLAPDLLPAVTKDGVTVTFLSRARIIRPDVVTGTAPNALINADQDPVGDETGFQKPLIFGFSHLQRRVSVQVGLNARDFSVDLVEARLTAFNSRGVPVGEARRFLDRGPREILFPLEVSASTNEIRRVMLAYSGNNAEVLDNLEFEASASLPVPPDTNAPVVFMQILPPWTHCERVRLIGVVDDSSSASLVINGDPVPLARYDPNRYWFNTEIVLVDGSNSIPFIVWDEFNNTSEGILTLELRRPARFAALTPHFSQSGLVGADPFPPTRLVARKTSVFSVNLEVLTADFRDSAVDRAELAVETAAGTNVLAGKLRTYDGRLITPGPEGFRNGEAVYFIIGGNLLPPAAPVGLVLRLYACGSPVHQERLASGWIFREAPPLTLLLQPQHRPLDETHTRALFRVLDHFTRLYPVADGVAELDGPAPGGVRVHLLPPLSYRDHLDPDDTIPPGDFLQGFLLHDHTVGFGPGPDGIIGTNAAGISDDLTQSEFWPGEFLVMNFTFAEDANRNRAFDPVELSRVVTPAGGGPTPVYQRVDNWTTFAGRAVENLRLAWNRERNLWPERQAASKGVLVTYRQNRNCENRGCLGGNARAPWASIEPSATPFLPHEITHTLGIRGDYTTSCAIVSIAVDLLNRRFVSAPGDLMCSSIGGGPTNFFLRPSDYTALFDRFLPPTGGGGAAARSTLGLAPAAAPEGASEFFVLVGSLTTDGAVNVAESFLAPNAIPTEDTVDLTYTLAFLSAAGDTLAESPFPVSFDSPHMPEPFTLVPFSVVRPFPKGTQKVQLRKQGVPLAAWVRSPNAPKVTAVTAEPYPQPDSTEAVLVQWTATDDDGDPLTFSLSYSPGTGKPFVPMEGGLRTNQLVLATADLSGSVGAVFKVVASDGFNTDEALSNPIALQRMPPVVVILSPDAGTAFDPREEILLRAAAWDAEDGLLGDTALAWYLVEPGGPKWLGNGSQLLLPPLPPGAYEVLVEATDSDGLSQTDKRTIVVTTGDAPKLSIRPLDRGQVELTWPADAAGYVLETTDSLTPLIYWRPVAKPPTSNGQWLTVSEDTPLTGTFYRLRRP